VKLPEEEQEETETGLYLGRERKRGLSTVVVGASLLLEEEKAGSRKWVNQIERRNSHSTYK